MPEEIFTMYGATDNTNKTGTFSLLSDILQASVTNIRIPAGMDLKIWARNLIGAAVTVSYQYSKDVTAGSPTWNTIAADDLIAPGQFEQENRKPRIFRGILGTEGVQVIWSQTNVGTSDVEFVVEISDEALIKQAQEAF